MCKGLNWILCNNLKNATLNNRIINDIIKWSIHSLIINHSSSCKTHLRLNLLGVYLVGSKRYTRLYIGDEKVM